MKVITLAATLVVGTIGACIAVQGVPEKNSFQDKARNMVVRNIGGWRTERADPKKKELIQFFAKALPNKKLEATWKKQRILIIALSINGTMRYDGQTLELLSATMTGGVETTVARDSVEPGAKEPQITKIDSPAASYEAGTATLTASGGLTLTNTDKSAARSLTIRGANGTIGLTDVKAKATGIEDATINGPVTMEMTGLRQEKDPKTGKPIKVSYTVTGRSDKLVYSASKRTVTLTGNVIVTGDDPMLGGDLRATRAVLTLDADGELVSVDFDGPGETVLKDKKGGGR